MKKKLYFVLFLLALFGVFLIMNKKIYHNETPVKERINLEPADVVKTYIKLSLLGDESKVSSFITTIPPSFAVVCDVPNKESKPNNIKSSYLPEITNNSEDKRLEVLDELQKKPSGLIEANYIYLIKNSLKTVNIAKEMIYQDESFVDVKYETDFNSIIRRFYLKKTDSWKIFLVVGLDGYPSFLLNNNYAKERHSCEQDH